VIQTGPKAELGGVKAGFFKPAYQVGIAGIVKIAPMLPAPSQAAILTINLIISVPLKRLDSAETYLRYESRFRQDYPVHIRFAKELI
jgi:hypothetical protein